MLEYVKQPPQSSNVFARAWRAPLNACLETACNDQECDLTAVKALATKAIPTDDDLRAAIQNGRLDVVIALHGAGANIRFFERPPRSRWPLLHTYPGFNDPLKDRPLLYAIKANRVDIVEYLIRHGAELVNVESEVGWAEPELSPEMLKHLTERGLKLRYAEEEREKRRKVHVEAEEEREKRLKLRVENEQLLIQPNAEYHARLVAEQDENRWMAESFPYKAFDGSGATICERLSVDDLIKFIDLSIRRPYGDRWRYASVLRTIQALDILDEQGDLTPEVSYKVIRHLSSGDHFFLPMDKIILHLASKGTSFVDFTLDVKRFRKGLGSISEYQTLYELGANLEGHDSKIGPGGLQMYQYHLRHFQLNRDLYMESSSPLLRDVLSCAGPAAIDRGAQLASRIALITFSYMWMVPFDLRRGKAHNIFDQLLTNELQALEKTARDYDREKLEREIDELLRDAVDLKYGQFRLAQWRIMCHAMPFTNANYTKKVAGSLWQDSPQLPWNSLMQRLVATRGLRDLIDLIKLMSDPKTLPPLEYQPYHALAASPYHERAKQWEPLFEGEIRLSNNYEAHCIGSDLEFGSILHNSSGIDGIPWYVSISRDGNRCGTLEVKLDAGSEGASSTGRRLKISVGNYDGDEYTPNLEDLCKELEQKAQAGEISFNRRIDDILAIPRFAQQAMSMREILTGVPDDEPELLARFCEHYLKLEQQLGGRILDDVSFEEIILKTAVKEDQNGAAG
jgi:hypothetical protein